MHGPFFNVLCTLPAVNNAESTLHKSRYGFRLRSVKKNARGNDSKGKLLDMTYIKNLEKESDSKKDFFSSL